MPLPQCSELNSHEDENVRQNWKRSIHKFDNMFEAMDFTRPSRKKRQFLYTMQMEKSCYAGVEQQPKHFNRSQHQKQPDSREDGRPNASQCHRCETLDTPVKAHRA
ncbi:hypothetical protein RRG08_039333 [Elysia crispata]|uniref:Uncharacterized protein n=1 Tax=Elysia crispata TaxID=231223 RepID=A0AAE1D346_9GAST|nr:hypothetical protein RRG08_039333 [Elysia crispata]